MIAGSETIRLNIGAGTTVIDGFTPIDRKAGQEGYPLDFADGSVSEIYASHVLEHYSHRDVSAVVNHWVKKLKPGGRLRIAVPDFQVVAATYLAKKPINVQGYVMGGHSDEDDRHGCIFDRESLAEIMASAGLERIRPWRAELQDCAALDVSLNLSGYKPLVGEAVTGAVAVLSAPRFGPLLHTRCAYAAFMKAQVPYQITQGAYWHQVMSECLETQLEAGREYIYTCDFDTVFSAQDVIDLYRLMRTFPEADAICAVQSKRSSGHALFGMKDEHGAPVTTVAAQEFDRHLTRISTGHFGLTIFRASSLQTFARPWMQPKPNKDGRWTDGKIDADIDFWNNWERANKTLFLANRVVVGHLQEQIAWPNVDFSPVYQGTAEYTHDGPPPEAAR